MEWSYGKYLVSTDKDMISLDAISDYLINRSYWANSRTREQISKSIDNSICFGLYDGSRQIGFARVVTDYATMYWLCDVFVEEEYRGQGLGKFIVECVVNYPDIRHLGGKLATKDAQSLYEKYGFSVPDPAKATYMGKRGK